MISIALCDDETKYLDYYEAKINDIALKNKLLVDIIRFKSGEALLFYLEDHPTKFDIIFLDIITGGLNGIDTALKIRTFNLETKIIFLTTSEEFVFNAFEANPTEYLLKSFHEDKFEPTFLKAINSINLNKNKVYLNFTFNKENYSIPLATITHIESYKRLVIVHTIDDEYEYYYKLSDLEAELKEKGFVLTHRSFLVNLAFIHKIGTDTLTLKNQVSLPISRNHHHNLKEVYINYLNGLIK